MTPETTGYIDAVEGRPPTLSIDGKREYEIGYKKGVIARKKINPLGQQKFTQEKSDEQR